MLQQTHIKGAPKEIFLGVSIEGVSIYRTSDKAVYETYRFAELASWEATPKKLILKVWKDGSGERLQHEIVFPIRTGTAEAICMLLMDYAVWLARVTTAAKPEESEPELELQPDSEPEPQPQSSVGTSSKTNATVTMTDVYLDIENEDVAHVDAPRATILVPYTRLQPRGPFFYH